MEIRIRCGRAKEAGTRSESVKYLIPDRTQQMRQADRLGTVMTRLEQQRLSVEHERKIMNIQLRLLSDEVSSGMVESIMGEATEFWTAKL